MTRTIVKRTIAAPIERVFAAVADIENLPNVIPNIVRVELLSEANTGIGTRFRETRVMNGKEHVTDLEVTELVPNERIRMVADSHGTIWDTVFTARESGGKVELVLTMDANAKKLLSKVMNPLFKGLVKKGLEKHMDAVVEHCERASSPSPG